MSTPSLFNAQTDNEVKEDIDPAVSVGLGIGLGGGVLNLGYSAPLFHGVIAAQYYHGHQIFGAFGEPATLDEFGVLYGLTIADENSTVVFSAGVSYLIFNHWKSSPESGRKMTVGFPIEGQFIDRSSKNLNFGMILHGILNTYQITGGIIFFIRIG